jgi:hypothetical protein
MDGSKSRNYLRSDFIWGSSSETPSKALLLFRQGTALAVPQRLSRIFRNATARELEIVQPDLLSALRLR